MNQFNFSILVNDRSSEFGQVICRRCEQYRWNCIQADDRDEFVALLQNRNFDLVCMQMIHPELDGLGALQLMSDAGYVGKVLMFNQSIELYSRVADHLSMALGFDIRNHRWPLSEHEIDTVLRQAASS